MTRHILLVDEPGEDQVQIAQFLRGDGHKVTELDAGEKALAFLERTAVDVVITELMMPDINGWDVLEMIKNLYPHIHVVVMTSRISEAAEEILTDRRADGYLVKPVDLERLEVLLNALLDPQNLDRDAEVALISAFPKDREVLEGVLNDRGVRVFSFDDEKPFFRHVHVDEPDLIVMELNPKLGVGMDVCREIRVTRTSAHIPILLIVERPSRKLVEQAIRLRVNGILVRPFDPDEVGDRVINMLKQADFKKTKQKRD